MITTLQNQDTEGRLINIDKRDILQSITIEDVKNFLESLGVDQIVINEEKGHLICPTICHNPLHEAESMKLYWYQNNKIFRCYTECNENMSIFRLYQKFIKINEGYNITEEEAEDYVKRCLKHIVITTMGNTTSAFSLDLDKYKFNKHIPQLEEYPKSILTYFTNYHHPIWLKEGITDESMDKFNIKFSIGQNKIIIPHFDIQDRLVGIRARALEKKEIELGKYRPIQIGTKIYAHPLQFNLYGIYEHKEGIKARRSAIIVEGEKSVLLDDGYYGKYSNAVACCGSTFNKYHISLLTDVLGANEIIVAFDKEYVDWHDDKARRYREKLENL